LETLDVAFVSGYVETAPRIFTGDTFSGTSRAVAFGADTWVGNWVNTSGSMTGEHGGIQVTHVNATNTWGGQKYIGLTRGVQYQWKCAAGGGDSGGPVFSYIGNDDSRVIARGIIHSTGYEGSPPFCQGINGNGFPVAASPSGHAVLFVPIQTALDRTGAKLRKFALP
jgi:hypothetical protein